MKLMGIGLSPYVRKVAVVLAAKGVSYEQEVLVPGMFPPEFQEVSPLMKIPVLVDGDLVLPDSSVICEYLNDKYPTPNLLPEDIALRAKSRFMEEYGDTKLMEVVSIPFIQNFINPRLRNQEPDAKRIEQAEQELIPPVLDYLESLMPEDGFLFGDFCIADIALVSPMVNAGMGGYQPDPVKWPKYVAYVQRVKQLEAFAKVLEAEAEVLASLG